MTLRVLRMVEEQFHRDVEDRPIREGRTPRAYLREGDIEYRTCPYTGSRHQHANPMNVSALRQTGAHWDAIIGALARLRELHDRARAVDGPPQLMDIWRVTQLGSSLPWFYIFRDLPIPAYAAALAKASLGMGIWAQRVLVRVLTDRGWSPPPFTAESILEIAEANGTLIGETEVCSGGDKMLLKYFDVHVTPTPEPGALDLPETDVLRFGAHYTNFKLALWIYFLARRFLYADIGAAAAEQMQCGVEPSDFFIVEPSDLTAVSPEQRIGWLRQLADLIVPFAPDASDLPLRDAAFAMAATLGQGGTPAQSWRALDELFAVVVAHVEVGLRGAGRAGDIDVPPEVRDRLIGMSPRALFDRIGDAP